MICKGGEERLQLHTLSSNHDMQEKMVDIEEPPGATRRLPLASWLGEEGVAFRIWEKKSDIGATSSTFSCKH